MFLHVLLPILAAPPDPGKPADNPAGPALRLEINAYADEIPTTLIVIPHDNGWPMPPHSLAIRYLTHYRWACRRIRRGR